MRFRLAKAASGAESLATNIRRERDAFAANPHELEGPALLAWQRLNQAQAFVTKAALLVKQLSDPKTAAKVAIDPDDIAELEAIAGFTQEADEAISAGQVPLTIELAEAGQPQQAAEGPAWEWPEEDMPWRGGGEVPGG
jgi:hypothetical protein